MPGCRTAPFARRIGLATALAISAPVAAPAQTALTANGTEFVLTMPAGRTLRSADLVGATLSIAVAGTQAAVTIESVEEDRHAIGGRVLLHHFVVRDQAGGAVDMCTPDADGRGLGFPVPDGHGGFDLTCTSGAIGKCIRWGYRPWEDRPGGPPLAALHEACVHMARADYGGDGQATTRAGTVIHWCDRFGVHPCEKDVPLAFEAAWGRDGATCVARPRIAENVSLEQLAERYPRLKPHLGPAACSEDGAMRDPAALLFNHSGG
jgi:ADYC domain